MDNKKNSSLAINNEAVVQIAGMAALEIEGVAALGKRPVELKNIRSLMKSSRTSYTKSIVMTVDNGALMLDVYICLKETAKLKATAEAVQDNVKDKVQSMTGNAVACVNVHVEDLATENK